MRSCAHASSPGKRSPPSGSATSASSARRARGRDPAETLRRVHEALEANIDLIDVAPEDDTERAVGDAVRVLRARDRAIVATRLPELTELPGGAPTRDLMLERLPLRYVIERVDAVLRKTKLDALPLVQLPLHAKWRAVDCVARARRHVRAPRPRRQGPALGCDRERARARRRAVARVDRDRLLAVPARCASPLIAAGTAKKIAVLALPPARRWCARRHARSRRRASRRATIAARSMPTAARSDRGRRREARIARQARAARRRARATRRAAIFETTPRPPNLDRLTTIAELALRYVIDRGVIALPRIHQRAIDLIELVIVRLRRSLARSADRQDRRAIARIQPARTRLLNTVQ